MKELDGIPGGKSYAGVMIFDNYELIIMKYCYVSPLGSVNNFILNCPSRIIQMHGGK